MNNKFTNRLIHETSPYLLQHAHNPVEWFAWGEEALSKAKSENKVMLVSIGYSACHWCHVMERESFENEAVARIMNEHFINIKIDREERPDLDHIYMDAVQAITGSGGWPLNIFLTPDAKPFYGGTYFPPAKAFNRASWTDVLEGISKAWSERRNEIESQAENLTDHLRKSNGFAQSANIISTTGEATQITIEQCHQMFAAIMKSADTQWGGFGKAPKFPQTFTIQFLLQYHYFTKDTIALRQALLSLDRMLMGGIYDHIDGGLARYSTDNEWLAPHFEKMLYDNALLIITLCDAYQLTLDKKYEDAIRKTILFIKLELLSNEGGFYAALDADSEGEEGKYYVWQQTDIVNILGKDADLFCAFFNVSENGNWERNNILRQLKSIDEFVIEMALDKHLFIKNMDACLQKLSIHRANRIKPALDDKIILGWNALMLKAVAKAAIVLQDEAYREMAALNFDFVIKNFKNETSGLLHTYKNGIAKYPAFLDDYSYLIAACLQLYKTTLNERYLDASLEYSQYVIEHFSDEAGVFFFFTHQQQKDIVVRKIETYDGATPSGNAIMAENLFQLSILFDKPEWGIRAEKMLKTLDPSIVKYPGSFGIWAGLLLQQLIGLNEIAVIGTNFASVSNNILLNFIPNMIMMSGPTENKRFALMSNKPHSATTLIYLCRNYTCMAPFEEHTSLLKQINSTNIITE